MELTKLIQFIINFSSSRTFFKCIKYRRHWVALIHWVNLSFSNVTLKMSTMPSFFQCESIVIKDVPKPNWFPYFSKTDLSFFEFGEKMLVQYTYIVCWWTLMHWMNTPHFKLDNNNNNSYLATLSHPQSTNKYISAKVWNKITKYRIQWKEEYDTGQNELLKSMRNDMHKLKIRYHLVICFPFKANRRNVRFYSVWWL